MRRSSDLSYDDLENKVIEMYESLAHLSRDERDKIIRQDLGISRAVLREVRGESDLLEFAS